MPTQGSLPFALLTSSGSGAGACCAFSSKGLRPFMDTLPPKRNAPIRLAASVLPSLLPGTGPPSTLAQLSSTRLNLLSWTLPPTPLPPLCPGCAAGPSAKQSSSCGAARTRLLTEAGWCALTECGTGGCADINFARRSKSPDCNAPGCECLLLCSGLWLAAAPLTLGDVPPTCRARAGGELCSSCNCVSSLGLEESPPPSSASPAAFASALLLCVPVLMLMPVVVRCEPLPSSAPSFSVSSLGARSDGRALPPSPSCVSLRSMCSWTCAHVSNDHITNDHVLNEGG